MALEDSDRTEIARMIAEASRQARPPDLPQRSHGGGEGRPSADDWDQMSYPERQGWVRRQVQDELKAQDEEVERQNLRAENAELKRRIEEAKKSGGRAPKTLKDKPEGEQRPLVVSKVYEFLFGKADQP